MSKDILKKLNDIVGRRVNYVPYDITKVKVSIGIPPIGLVGLEYIFARFNQTQNNMVMSLTGGGVYVANNNQSGIIEVALLGESVSCAAIQVMTMTGIPFPVHAIDNTTNGTSQVVGTACKLTETPEWRRSKFPDLNIFTFSTTRLFISHGLRDIET